MEGDHATTASNVAKYDGFHGVIVFDDHNPLHLTPEKVAGYVSVGLEWGRKALEADPEARYLPDVELSLAGRWIHHPRPRTGHGNPRLPLPEGRTPPPQRYGLQLEHGSDYFEDLYTIHASLGLDIPLEGTRAFASLSPSRRRSWS